jgi:hypothetical protein
MLVLVLVVGRRRLAQRGDHTDQDQFQDDLDQNRSVAAAVQYHHLRGRSSTVRKSKKAKRYCRAEFN